MNATQWAAWVGASTGVGSLLWNVLWNVYTKRSTGPRLRVSPVANFVQKSQVLPTGLNRIYYCKVDMPPPGEPKFLRITVENIGTAPTTIQELVFETYRWAKFRYQLSEPYGYIPWHDGPQLPHKLDVGGQFVAHIEQDGTFDKWLSSGNLWCGVVHSFSTRPARAKIPK